MKNNLILRMAGLLVSLFFMIPLMGQWSSPETLFPGIATPGQFPGEAGSSPYLAASLTPDGNIHLVWSNEGEYGTTLMYAVRQNGKWGLPEEIPGTGPISIWPNLLADASGTLLATWVTAQSEESFQICFSKKVPGQDWTSPVVVSAPDYPWNSYPRLISGDDGKIHLFYTAAYPAGMLVYTFVKHYTIDPENPGTPQMMTSPPANPQPSAFNPVVGKDPSGHIQCIWYDYINNSRCLFTSGLEGSQWSPLMTLASNGSQSFLMDESPAVLVHSSPQEMVALWLSLQPESAQYRTWSEGSGWSDLQSYAMPQFRFPFGIHDSQYKCHFTGNDDDERGGDLYYHTYAEGEWGSERIEMGTPNSMPGFSALLLSGDTLFCYYIRYTSGPCELVQSWKVLNYLTPVEDPDCGPEMYVQISPNPAGPESRIFIQGHGGQPIHMAIVDCRGKTAAAKQFAAKDVGNAEIPLSEIVSWEKTPAGIYLLRIQSGSKTYTRKIVIR